MKIQKEQISDYNKKGLENHNDNFDFLANKLSKQGHNVSDIVSKLAEFQVAIPSWALGAGGTRFGRFSFYGEPSTLEQKIDDIAVLHSLTQTAGAVSLHIPWDIPTDYAAIKEQADALNIKFDAVNSNTFQDQKDAAETYKYGSLSNISKAVREQAIQHNLDVIKIGDKLGSKALTVWLADGSSFPGQNNFQTAFQNTQDSLIDIYKGLPDDWKMLVEYKPYEPNFYSTVIQDWGASLMLANGCGDKAYTLVDLGHHLPNSNIEQIVSILQLKGKLGGFHFNDSKYGDDDLTVGSIKPYALFLIFNELVYGMENNPQNPDLAWMIDASHNIKDPLEDLIQSLEAIQEAYAKALLIDQKALKAAQLDNDVVKCQEILQGAYRTDVRPLLEKARLNKGGVLNPINAYRSLDVRGHLIKERGKNTVATGL
ncbi:sugar isomerase [Algibacter amylolyticus]|uniref:Sugar isomerase n=1 Tax=Algibacter amylolyticus TaxID=1608400 RepID=A0A5M7B9D0_9FLAO|nr:sugar isomerase [Algibacter amylolyticus]KAA5824817.1 sugar isomerase [Algibacter amylolyticus]MBB5268937.1 L-rhamnose isomerase/sugar isomerase [Algibacter amylolyticus]TSJ75982.1 sugar isomerase [Algibacter amylolyticus]